MPELPEVETVKEVLKTKVLGKKIKEVEVYWDKIIAYPVLKDFIELIKNQSINNIDRRGKWLIFELDNYYLLSHLRMEGKYFFKNNKDHLNKHEHVVFKFTDESELRYHDTRKFGKMYLIQKEELNNSPIGKLGLEPFDSKLNIKYLKNKLFTKIIPIKTTLLDQSIITGIGNIYVDEILFLSGINPEKKANQVTSKELGNIIENTKVVLGKAIKAGGTTIRSYTSSEGITGMFQNELLVHSRAGEICNVCGSIIKKTKIRGRGTYFCPKCQK